MATGVGGANFLARPKFSDKAWAHASSKSPKQRGVIRPSGLTPVASRVTSAAPEFNRLLQCAKCQSVARPSCAEYWHMGATTMRLAKCTGPLGEFKVRGEKRWDKVQNSK